MGEFAVTESSHVGTSKSLSRPPQIWQLASAHDPADSGHKLQTQVQELTISGPVVKIDFHNQLVSIRVENLGRAGKHDTPLSRE